MCQRLIARRQASLADGRRGPIRRRRLGSRRKLATTGGEIILAPQRSVPWRRIWPRPEPEATRELRKFYQAGVKILKASGGTHAIGSDRKNFWGVNEDLREELKMSLNYTTRARQLVRLYPTPQALDWLCGLGQRRGKPLTKSHAMVLVGIQDPKLRKTLATQAAREGWSERRLRSEAAAAAAKPRTAGRGSRPQLLGPIHALSNTRHLAVKWLNWCDRLQRAANKDLGRLANKEITACLAATEKPMRRVRDAVQEAMAGSSKKRVRKNER